MATVQINSEINLHTDQLLDGVAQLETSELEKFLAKVSLILAQRKRATLPASEADLIQKINHPLSSKLQERYDELNTKLHDQTMTSDEHQELLKLIEVTEKADAERMQNLLALAQLRQMPLPELMEQMGLKPPPVHA